MKNTQFEYYVDKENKVVIAVMKNTKMDAFDFIKANTKAMFPLIIAEDIDKTPKRMLMKEKYIGKAKCSSEDVFDIKVGKEIARAKALRKHYKDFYKIIIRWTKELDFNIKKINEKSLNKYISTVTNERVVLEKTLEGKNV